MALTLSQVPPLALPQESKEETTTPEATPRTHREREDGTARLKETLGRLRTLTEQVRTPRDPVTPPTPVSTFNITFQDGFHECLGEDLHRISEATFEILKTTTWAQYQKILTVVKRGYLIREEMEDGLLVAKLKGMKVKLQPPPFDDNRLVALPWSRLEELTKCGTIWVNYIEPLLGKVMGEGEPLQILTRDKLDSTVVVLMDWEDVKSLGCPPEHQFSYTAISFEKRLMATKQFHDWCQERGAFAPAGGDYMEVQFTGCLLPHGYYLPSFFSPTIYQGKELPFIVYHPGTKTLTKPQKSAKSVVVVLDDEGYPLTSPIIPRFG